MGEAFHRVHELGMGVFIETTPTATTPTASVLEPLSDESAVPFSLANMDDVETLANSADIVHPEALAMYALLRANRPTHDGESPKEAWFEDVKNGTRTALRRRAYAIRSEVRKSQNKSYFDLNTAAVTNFVLNHGGSVTRVFEITSSMLALTVSKVDAERRV